MIEDYAIHLRTCRAYSIGKEIGRNGRMKDKKVYRVTYATDAGEFSPEEWLEKALAEITKYDEMELLAQLKKYCKENRAWLRNEKEVEVYAVSCLCSRAYLHWYNFSIAEEIK